MPQTCGQWLDVFGQSCGEKDFRGDGSDVSIGSRHVERGCVEGQLIATLSLWAAPRRLWTEPQ